MNDRIEGLLTVQLYKLINLSILSWLLLTSLYPSQDSCIIISSRVECVRGNQSYVDYLVTAPPKYPEEIM